MRIFDLRSHCLSAWPLSVWKQASYLSIEPEHGHDCYEIMITLKDGGICLVGGSNYAIRVTNRIFSWACSGLRTSTRRSSVSSTE